MRELRVTGVLTMECFIRLATGLARVLISSPPSFASLQMRRICEQQNEEQGISQKNIKRERDVI